MLELMKLKSLTKIKCKYERKKRYKIKKIKNKEGKISKRRSVIIKSAIPEIEAKYEQKLILNQLKELTSLVKRIEKEFVN